MALTADKLTNNYRFNGENVIQLLLYIPLGIILLLVRLLLAMTLWIAAIILPNKSGVRHMLSTLACWTFGVYVKVKGTRDPRCSVLVANYVSCLDSLAASHALGTISLRKWKVPPFFASTLGIRNVAQFIKKQHFADTPSRPILLQPEGGPTNGKGLLKFTDWPFPLGNRVQPVSITVERLFTSVSSRARAGLPWRDAAWFLSAPLTVFSLRLLPPLERHDDSTEVFAERIATAIAADLDIPTTEVTWSSLISSTRTIHASRSGGPPGGVGGLGVPGGSGLAQRAAQVKEVLPSVPTADILRDLAKTRSVDVTITNFLEGLVPYTPEVEPENEPGPSTSQSQPKYVIPAPTGTFAKTAKERQMSFHEKKEQMIAEARQRYIEKHGLTF